MTERLINQHKAMAMGDMPKQPEGKAKFAHGGKVESYDKGGKCPKEGYMKGGKMHKKGKY